MNWTPIVRKPFTIPQLKDFVNSLDFSNWKPSLIVWHNTSAPTIAQWEKTAEQDKGNNIVPGLTRINNLENYFQTQGWSSGPHAFVWQDVVWAFTPFNRKGTHSPSWNGISIGIEMIGEFEIEDDETGYGQLIKQNTIALTAILCEKLGLDPTVAVRLHKEDPKTTHKDCPGKHIAADKQAMIDSVLEYMGHGGEHTVITKPVQNRKGIVDVAENDHLNIREKSSASSNIVFRLPAHISVDILNEATNGNTKWFYVSYETYKGWVSAKFIKETL